MQQGVQPAGDDTLTFDRLNLSDLRLSGPSISNSSFFQLPMNWRMKAAGHLDLQLDVVIPGVSDTFAQPAFTNAITDTVAVTGTLTATSTLPALPARLQPRQRFGGELRIVINSVGLKTIALNASGEYTVSVTVPPQAFAKLQPEGQSIITFDLSDQSTCGDSLGSTSVVVRNTSRLVLPHITVPLVPNLNMLPRPLFQHSVVSDTALLIVPDTPTPIDLQAALDVAAGFGRMTDGRLGITLTRLSDVTRTLEASNHLIFVGKPSALPTLAGMTMPMPISQNRFAKLTDPDDGVVQMVVSPWNDGRAALVVSGNTDAGLLKAAQALTSGALRADKGGNLAVIAGVKPVSTTVASNAREMTFGALGYGQALLSGQGTRYANFNFDLPTWPAKGDAELSLSFAHSALLDYEQSGVSVILNGLSVGAIRFSDNSTSVKDAHISLPRTTLQATNNSLLLRVDIIPRTSCLPLNSVNAVWVSIQPESTVHFATEGEPPPSAPARRPMLSDFPAPFASASNLAGVAFVVSKADPSGWDAAAHVAMELGRRASDRPVNLTLAFAGDVPPAMRQSNNVLIIGRASQLPIMADLNPVLPAPFAPQSDFADDSASGVQVRSSAKADVGYLQIVPAPWQSERTVLLVMGTSAAGVEHAAMALIRPELKSALSGNLAIVTGDDGEKIVSTDTFGITTAQSSTSAGTTTESASAVKVAASTASASKSNQTPSDSPGALAAAPVAAPAWILPLVIGAVALLVLVLVISGVALVIQRRRI